MQKSMVAMFRTTSLPTPLSDFNAKFYFKQPPNPSNAFDVQFNLMSFLHWYQFVYLSENNELDWLVDGAYVHINTNYGNPNFGQEYLLQPSGAGFAHPSNTGTDVNELMSGKSSLNLSKKGGVFTMSVAGTKSWSQSFPVVTDIPYCLTVELVSNQPNSVEYFSSGVGQLDFTSVNPIQTSKWVPSVDVVNGKVVFPHNYEFQWGECTGIWSPKPLPLWWWNNTGEMSNIWTNILSQTISSVSLKYSCSP